MESLKHATRLVLVLTMLIFSINLSKQQYLADSNNSNYSDVYLEFDEKDIRNLNLKLKWGFDDGGVGQNRSSGNGTILSNKTSTRFVLLMETKRINFSTFLFDYSSPQLIDDEQVIKASLMKAENFKKRVVLYNKSNLDCSMSCINSSKFSTNEKTFDCNIFYYDSTTRTCVLYEYDFVNEYKKKRFYNIDEIYDYFNDECDMDEILGDVVGYSRLCKRILDYRDEHVIKINPYIDYRFSISLRNEKYEWTPFFRREYQYAPKITIDVKGDIKLGNNLTLECKTELSESIVDSITWKNNNPALKGNLIISPLTIGNIYQTYYCEIRFNFFRMIQKAFRLNATNLGDLKPILKINYSTDVESLNLTLNWTVTAPIGSRFKPEKMILLYSENNSTYKFVNKYLLFDLSKFDNARLASARDSEDITTTNEDECAMNCLQKSFCDHFVFIRSIEPFRNSKKKNCRLVTNNQDNLFPCRYDLICANLSPFERHVQNETINILILPNITYRFKIQLKDKHLNWTDVEETEPIYIPLKIKIDQRGDTEIVENNSNNTKFELICNSNINKNLQNQISWTRDDKEIIIDDKNFSVYSSNETQYANSVLVFKSFQNESSNYTGVYKCNIYIRYPEVGQGTSYLSDGKYVTFSYSKPLKYQKTVGNISLPTVPGLLLELNCQISGRPINSVKWLIDGVNFNEKNSFKQITDDPFVINITDPNDASLHNILVMKIDNPRKLAKYECVLNEDTVVKSHYIEIIDQKPEIDIKFDKSNLNRLKLSIDLKLKKSSYLPKYAPAVSSIPIDTKPMKFFVLYVENSTFNSAYQTVIAPNTLSKTDTNWKPTDSDKIKLGSLKPTQHGIQSCKLVCFNTPFCKSYEYLIYDDSCNFYSDSKIDAYYKMLIDNLKSTSTSQPTQSNNFTFNLIHLLQADFFNLVEEKAFTNITLIDRKKYPGCEQKASDVQFDDELNCSDQLADFKTPYTIENLIPLTNYQFRIELSTAFGKSRVYLTESIQVPFDLNPITENIKDELYSLQCTTSILDTRKLKFKWFKNEQSLMENETISYEITSPKISNDIFYTELILKLDPRNSAGYYTCSLTYTGETVLISKNQSILFRPNIKPSYSLYTDLTLNKSVGDMWTDSCSAQGWPLPGLRWILNGGSVSNQTDNLISIPYTINHHRNLTVTSYIIAQNLTASSAGRYTCLLNSQLPIKNVTLLVNIPMSDDRSASSDISPVTSANSADKSRDTSNKKSKSSKLLLAVVVTILVIASISAVLFFIYYKRKRSNLNALLAYNRIEEELVTGVDNVNLTDDNNQ